MGLRAREWGALWAGNSPEEALPPPRPPQARAQGSSAAGPVPSTLPDLGIGFYTTDFIAFLYNWRGPGEELVPASAPSRQATRRPQTGHRAPGRVQTLGQAPGSVSLPCTTLPPSLWQVMDAPRPQDGIRGGLQAVPVQGAASGGREDRALPWQDEGGPGRRRRAWAAASSRAKCVWPAWPGPAGRRARVLWPRSQAWGRGSQGTGK